jgi:DNA-3-methyladenine glycosylase I
MKKRCPWTGEDPLMIAYHDEEWGVPVHDDATLFEFLILEGAQAGLSWQTVLKKRARYREVFHGFDPARIVRYTGKDRRRLLADAGIIRNRLKIDAAISNAAAFLRLCEEFGSFDSYLWRFVDGRPRRNRFRSLADLPAKTPEAEALSRDLKKRGFRFVGPTICYAFMQAVGMVNDHFAGCFRYKEID